MRKDGWAYYFLIYAALCSFLFVLSFEEISAMQLSAAENLEIIDTGISLYFGNWTASEKSEFINSFKEIYGLDLEIWELGNKSISSDKKEKVWEEIKKRIRESADTKTKQEAQANEELKNSFTYKKKLFYENLTFYLESLDSKEREEIVQEINSKYTLEINTSDLSNLNIDNATRDKIDTYLRSQIELAVESNKSSKRVFSAIEFIENNGEDLRVLGRNVSLKLIGGGLDLIEIESFGVSAKSGLNLSVETNSTEDQVIRASLSNGREVVLKIMPDQALKTVSRLGGTECLDCAIELGEETVNDKIWLCYTVISYRQTKFLFFLNKKIDSEILVDAEGGGVIKINKPWWSFLAREV